DEDEEDADTAVDEQLQLFGTVGPSSNRPDDSTTLSAPAPKPARPPRPDEVVALGEAKRIDASLYRLRLRARSALQEQGINILFVTFGIVGWVEASASDERILGPLILVPVRLDRGTVVDPYRLAPLDEGLIFNPAPARKLQLDFKLPLDLPDDSDTDLTLDQAL